VPASGAKRRKVRCPSTANSVLLRAGRSRQSQSGQLEAEVELEERQVLELLREKPIVPSTAYIASRKTKIFSAFLRVPNPFRVKTFRFELKAYGSLTVLGHATAPLLGKRMKWEWVAEDATAGEEEVE
jgi:hypothetical protein